MSNPSTGWDLIPVYGVYLKSDDTPITGNVQFTFSQRVMRVDGRIIYPEGATVLVPVGDQTKQDSTIRSTVRAAWRAADEAALGGSFDGVAWDSWWDDTIVPAAVFVGFPGLDDPDIVPIANSSVTVKEDFTSGKGKEYSITPLVAQLDTPIPGINLGTIVVPVDAPDVPSSFYAKDTPGGIAGLDGAGKLASSTIPDGITGVSSWNDLTDKPAVIGAGATQAAARAAIDAEQSGAAASAVAAHVAAADPHAQYLKESDAATTYATPTDVSNAIAALVGTAGTTLDTLGEIATALANDPALSATLTALIGTKVGKTGDETIAGIKTFSSAPVVPDGSFVVAKLSGYLDLAHAAPGARFTCLWNGATSKWQYNGVDLNARPSARADIYFDLVGAPASTADPAWWLTGDARDDIDG